MKMKSLLLATTLVLSGPGAFAITACDTVNLKNLEDHLLEIVATGKDEAAAFSRIKPAKAQVCAKALYAIHAENHEELKGTELEIALYVDSIMHPLESKKAK